MTNGYNNHANPIGRHFSLFAASALILLATIFRGGNRYVPLNLLEWLGLAVFLGWALNALLNANEPHRSSLGTGKRRWALMALIALPAWIALLQLIPLPSGTGWHALSKVPQATWASALAGIPIAALFLSALAVDSRALKVLVRFWVAVAVFQGALGVLQLGGFEVLNFGGPKTTGVVGTFANRNHFASFIAMAIPLAMLSLKPHRPDPGKAGAVSWPAVAMLFVLVAGLFASLSRAGLVLGLTAAMATGWMLWRPTQQKNHGSSSWLRALVPLLVLLALAAGGLDWLSRFDASQLELSARVREINRLSAWAAAQANWPMGSGLGTLSSVFPTYQAAEIPQLVDHAHNDYVEWLLEMGIFFPIAVLILGTVAGPRLAQWAKSTISPSKQNKLALACAMGLLAVSLHAWVDFPLHIPANAMLAAFLLGTFLREPEPNQHISRRRPRA